MLHKDNYKTRRETSKVLVFGAADISDWTARLMHCLLQRVIALHNALYVVVKATETSVGTWGMNCQFS